MSYKEGDRRRHPSESVVPIALTTNALATGGGRTEEHVLKGTIRRGAVVPRSQRCRSPVPPESWHRADRPRRSGGGVQPLHSGPEYSAAHPAGSQARASQSARVPPLAADPPVAPPALAAPMQGRR